MRMKYWFEPKFESRKKSDDNKATVWDTENLNELSSWDIAETGQYASVC